MVAVNEPVTTIAYFRQDAGPGARPRIPGMLEGKAPEEVAAIDAVRDGQRAERARALEGPGLGL